MLTSIDFETRSECQIRKTGHHPYARHPSTEVLCLAAESTEGHQSLWLPGEEIPSWLREHVEAGGEMHAHNAAFEIAIWKHIMVKRLGWPEVRLRQWHCTAARCAALALPRSLAGAGEALGLSVQKDNEGHRVMMKLCKPRKPSKHDKRKYFDDPEDFKILYNYCVKDVKAEMAIHNATEPLQPMNRILWLLDQTINERGIPMDRSFIEDVLACDDAYCDVLRDELSSVTNGVVTTGSQQAKMLEWLNIKGVNIGDLTKATVAKTLDRDDLTAECRRVLEIRQLLSRTSTAKYKAMLQRMDGDDRIRGVHLFHGASTGRFTGMGVQFQNMPRPTHKYAEIVGGIESFKTRDPKLIEMCHGEQSSLAVSCIRSAVKASPSKRLIVCDFSGIEARVLGWLTGEEGYQQVFRSGGDIYVDFAARLYGKSPESITGSERFLGKVAILALGYGQGAGTDPKFNSGFWYTAADWGCPIEKHVADEVVTTFRETYKRIRGYWYKCGDAALACVKTGEDQYAGKCKFFMADDFLKLQLPSGRRLSYYKPIVRKEETKVGKKESLVFWGTNSVTRKWEECRTYGGKLVENIVQATALDLFANAMCLLEKNNYPVVFHVHDEVVVERDATEGSLAEVERLMCDIPPWAAGCVVDAEGFEEKRYRKAE